MRKFKLYAIHKTHRALITSFDSSNPSYINTTITYDEQLSEAENDQFTLTFSMPRFIAVDTNNPKPTNITNLKHVYNHWLDIVKMGSRLQLIIDDSRRIDFIVSAVAPALSRSNIVYNFTAQDEVSYLWSRHNLGYSYPWTEEEDDGPQCIAEFATRILRDNYLDHTWSVMWTPGPVIERKFSFSVDNSNPYNAMVEAANVLGYKFHINYNQRTISFYLPESEENKFSGYRYRPETNLKSFSASYDATQLCTIMHAAGGEDAQGQVIPLVPALPHAFSIWFRKNNTWKTGTTAEWILGEHPYKDILDVIIEAETSAGVCEIDKNYTVLDAEYTLNDSNPYTYFIGASFTSNQSSNKQIAIQQLQAEINECVDFVRIADKIPYLGQFIYNFEFFDNEHSGLMDYDTTFLGICDILNNMRVNNTILKINTPSYYSLLYTIAKKHAEMETLAEQYQAEWRVIADKCATAIAADEEATKNGQSPTSLQSLNLATNMQHATELENKLVSLFSSSYFQLFKSAYGTQHKLVKLPSDIKLQYYNFQNKNSNSLVEFQDKPIYPEWQTWVDNLAYAEKQYAEHQNKLWSLEAKRKKIDQDNTSTEADKIILDSEIESEKTYLQTYETLKSSWQINTGTHVYTIPGKWSMLIGLLYATEFDIDKVTEQGLATTIKQAEDANTQETARLYANYGDFIYESTYENTDELDSIGLYNQTVNNFALYNKPAASYNMTTIDLNCLEQISIPNVVVGAKIRVYNELLNLKDGENNNLQYTNNDLTITAISRKLRSADDVSFTVEKTNRINKLVEKLLINL